MQRKSLRLESTADKPKRQKRTTRAFLGATTRISELSHPGKTEARHHRGTKTFRFSFSIRASILLLHRVGLPDFTYRGLGDDKSPVGIEQHRPEPSEEGSLCVGQGFHYSAPQLRRWYLSERFVRLGPNLRF